HHLKLVLLTTRFLFEAEMMSIIESFTEIAIFDDAKHRYKKLTEIHCDCLIVNIDTDSALLWWAKRGKRYVDPLRHKVILLKDNVSNSPKKDKNSKGCCIDCPSLNVDNIISELPSQIADAEKFIEL